MFLQILCQRARNRFLAHRRFLHLPVRRHEVASMPASLDLLQVIGDDEIAPVAGEEVECDLPQLLWGFADLEFEAHQERIWGQLFCQLHGLRGRRGGPEVMSSRVPRSGMMDVYVPGTGNFKQNSRTSPRNASSVRFSPIDRRNARSAVARSSRPSGSRNSSMASPTAAIHSAILDISGSRIPRVVAAGVPSRIPDG